MLEQIANWKVVTTSKMGIENIFVWNYQEEENGTRLTVDVDYVTPVPLLGKSTEGLVTKFNEHEADLLLENLKTRMGTG